MDSFQILTYQSSNFYMYFKGKMLILVKCLFLKPLFLAIPYILTIRLTKTKDSFSRIREINDSFGIQLVFGGVFVP